MSIEENKAVMRRFIEEAWNQRKTSVLEELLSNDNMHHAGSVARPFGPENVMEIMETWQTGMPDFKFHIEDMIAEGDRVVARLRFTGTQTGPLNAMSYDGILPPSGKAFDEPEILIFRIAEGRVVESWATWDRLSFMKQLGGI